MAWILFPRRSRFVYVRSLLLLFPLCCAIVILNQKKTHIQAPLNDVQSLGYNRAASNSPEKYRDFVFVTAIQEEQIKMTRDLIGNIQRKFPSYKLIVYDLGLMPGTINRIRKLCGVEYRAFDFSKYPAHVKNIYNAFKPLVLKKVLEEYPAAHWVDVSVHFRCPGDEYLEQLTATAQRTKGVATRMPKGAQPTSKVSSLDIYNHLSINNSQAHSITIMATDSLYIHNSKFALEHVLNPWVQCALNTNCIAPQGSEQNCTNSTQTCQGYEELSWSILLDNASQGNVSYFGIVSDCLVMTRIPTNIFLLKTCDDKKIW